VRGAWILAKKKFRGFLVSYFEDVGDSALHRFDLIWLWPPSKHLLEIFQRHTSGGHIDISVLIPINQWVPENLGGGKRVDFHIYFIGLGQHPIDIQGDQIHAIIIQD
jgi:hypothetical protein